MNVDDISMTKVALGLAVSLVSGLVAARWTLRGALHQKLWERKEAAYREIFTALHELSLFYGLRASLSEQEHLLTDELSLNARRISAIAALERALDVDSWHVRSEALHAIRELVHGEGLFPNRYKDDMDFADRWHEVAEAMDKVRDWAQLELDPGRKARDLRYWFWLRFTPMGWLAWYGMASALKEDECKKRAKAEKR